MTRRDWSIAGGIVLLTLIVYARVWSAGFIWDDPDYVTQNLTLRTIDGIWRIWFEPSSLPQYYPLVHTSYWIEYRLWGLDPRGYHVVNVLLHAMSAVLVWRILHRLGMPGALLAALVFAVHPVMVESVAWVTERKNTLSMLMYLGSMYAFLRWSGVIAAPDEKPAGQWYAISLVLFVLALLSKSVTCSLPAALLVILWWRGHFNVRANVGMSSDRPMGISAALATLPFFVLGLAMAIVTTLFERHVVGAQGSEFGFSFADRLLIAGRAVWFYLGKLLWPADLAFIYPKWQIDPSQAWQWLFPAAAAGVVAGAWILRERIGRAPLAAVLLYGGTLLPALGFIDVYPMRYSFVADHFQYHASIYPIALISAVLWRWRPWPMLLVLPLAGLAFHQTRIYHDPLTLWLDTLGKNPNSWMVHTNLGKAFDAAGDAARSIAHHERALELAPHLPELHRNVGIVRMRQGRVEEALQAFQQAIEIDPTYPETYFSLGNHHLDRGEFEQAIAQYEKAIELAPEYAPAWANLGLAQLELRRLDDAIASLQRALELNPYLQGAQRSLHAARLMKSRGAPSGR